MNMALIFLISGLTIEVISSYRCLCHHPMLVSQRLPGFVATVPSLSRCSDKGKTEGLVYVLACFAREGRYLREWVLHYLRMGFDRIVLLDTNRGTTDSQYIAAVERLPCVWVVNKRDVNYSVPLQASFFNEFYATLRSVDWCLFVDLDEFFTLRNTSVRVYLSRAVAEGCDQVKLNWLCYGNNGHLRRGEGDVLVRFPVPVLPVNFTMRDVVWNGHVKSFVRGGLPGKFRNVHSLVGSSVRNCNGNLLPTSKDEFFVQPPVFDVSFIKHFWSKSQEEYEEKVFSRWKGAFREKGFYDWRYYDRINRDPPNVPYVPLQDGITRRFGPQ